MLQHRSTLFVTASVLTFVGGAQIDIGGYAGAETADLSEVRTQKCCDHSIQVTASRARSGKYSYMSQVYGFDPGVFPHHRAEIMLQNSNTVAGRSYWYGWSTFIPADWEFDPTWVLITQWHAPGAVVMQPLQLELAGNRWCWVNWIGIQPSAAYNVLWCENFANDKDKWVDWVVNAKWVSDETGYIHIWKNGKKIVDRAGPTIYGNFAPYWKAGLVYAESKKMSHRIYLDELRMGDASSSYELVAPK